MMQVPTLKATVQCPKIIMVPGGEKRYTTGQRCLPCVWCGQCGRRV